MFLDDVVCVLCVTAVGSDLLLMLCFQSHCNFLFLLADLLSELLFCEFVKLMCNPKL